jgi:hypothetical protein
VIALQMSFDPAYIEWLAHRLYEDRAFIGYQAVSALYARYNNVGAEEVRMIREAVRKAKDKMRDYQVPADPPRDALIEKILA